MALAAFINSPTGPMTTHFWGPIANWGLAASGMCPDESKQRCKSISTPNATRRYDAALKGPEIINERMSATQILYSGLFVRFAWAVQPRNYILASCHTANVLAQGNQLRRWGEYKIQTEPETGPSTVRTAGLMAAGAAAGIGAMVAASAPLQNSLKGGGGFLARMATHPAGPFYIHFWAPNFKWALSINNLMDYDRPTDKISLSMTSALTLTGLIFMRWSFVITPVNYSLFAVNLALSTSSGYLLARKVKADYIDK